MYGGVAEETTTTAAAAAVTYPEVVYLAYQWGPNRVHPKLRGCCCRRCRAACRRRSYEGGCGGGGEERPTRRQNDSHIDPAAACGVHVPTPPYIYIYTLHPYSRQTRTRTSLPTHTPTLVCRRGECKVPAKLFTRRRGRTARAAGLSGFFV